VRLLAIDIGNTRIKCALFDGEVIDHTFEMASDRMASGASFRHSLRANLGDRAPQAAAIASVVPELNDRVAEAARREFMVLPTFISAADLPADRVCYADPAALGADRIAAAVAGHRFYGTTDNGMRTVVVIDAGTAVTFEVIDAGGRYSGGAIWAGPQLVAGALGRGTSKLPEVEPVVPRSAVGTDTRSGLRAGIVYGFLGGVAEILQRVMAETDGDAFVVSTGGLGEWIAARIKAVDAFDPHLVLHGIRLLSSASG